MVLLLTGLVACVWWLARPRHATTEPARAVEGPESSAVGAILAETREELLKADAKASLTFAAIGLASTIVVGALVTVGYRPPDLLDRWLLVSAGACCLASVLSIGGAVWPRLGSGTAGKADYFMDIAASADAGMSVDHLILARSREARDCDELVVLSRSVRRKYRLLQWGLGASGGSIVLFIGAMLHPIAGLS